MSMSARLFHVGASLPLESNMKKFLVTYLAPAAVIADWKKTAPEKRKEAEEKMQANGKNG